MLFEIAVIGVIVFALAYWTTLFIMGRREDVLHGEFVETEGEAASVSVAPIAAPAVIFPPRPVIAPKQLAAPKPERAPAPPIPAVAPEQPADTEALQSLLVSLKQELKNAAQI
jgi:hypothetical protein